MVKISDEELAFLTGCQDIQQALPRLFVGNIQLVVYTCGSNGAYAFTRSAQAFAPCTPVKAVDTTGAGDAFIGSFLWQMAGTAGCRRTAQAAQNAAGTVPGFLQPILRRQCAAVRRTEQLPPLWRRWMRRLDLPPLQKYAPSRTSGPGRGVLLASHKNWPCRCTGQLRILFKAASTRPKVTVRS